MNNDPMKVLYPVEDNDPMKVLCPVEDNDEPEVEKWDVRWTILAILLIDAGLIWWLLDKLGVV